MGDGGKAEEETINCVFRNLISNCRISLCSCQQLCIDLIPTHLPPNRFSQNTVLDAKLNTVHVPVTLIPETVSQGKENNNRVRSHLCTPYGLSRIGSLKGGGIWPK